MPTLVRVAAAAIFALTAIPAAAYEVWMGTHLMQGTVASNLNDWDLAASYVDGVVINRAPNDNDPATNNEWRTIFDQFETPYNPSMQLPIPRSAVTRDTSLVNESAFVWIEDELQHQFNLANSFGYDVDKFLFYNNSTGGELYTWTDTEAQYMRDWLDDNGHEEIELVWIARNFGLSDRNWSENPLVDHVMIEGNAHDFINNGANKMTLLNWLWTNPNTIEKDVILQVPRAGTEDLTQYEATRRLAVTLADEIGYEDGLQSDRLVFSIVTYRDEVGYIPEVTSNGDAYTDTISGLALSLIEQRALFEGRSGIATNADADSFQRVLPLGDYNSDGLVNAADYTVWRGSFGADERALPIGAGDGSGTVGPGDYAFWANNFDAPATAVQLPPSALVPEPATVGLVLMATLVVAPRHRDS